MSLTLALKMNQPKQPNEYEIQMIIPKAKCLFAMVLCGLCRGQGRNENQEGLHLATNTIRMSKFQKDLNNRSPL